MTDKRIVAAKLAKAARARAPKLEPATRRELIEEHSLGIIAALDGLGVHIGHQALVTERMVETFGRQNQATERMLQALDRQHALHERQYALDERRHVLDERLVSTIERLDRTTDRTSAENVAALNAVALELSSLRMQRAEDSTNGHARPDSLER